MRAPLFRAAALVAALLGAACTQDTPTTAAPAGPTAADTPAAPAGPVSANFRCGDLLLGAEFDNAAGHVTLSITGQRWQLPQTVSASGARYADAQGNEFWNKGDAATLTLDGARHDCAVTEDTSPWDEARRRGVAFRGLGTEPFWSLEVDGSATPAMRLDLDMGQRPLVVAQAAPLAEGEGWSGTADDGSAVTLAVTRGDCSDGMSDQTYPAGIELHVGDETFRGCGAFLDR